MANAEERMELDEEINLTQIWVMLLSKWHWFLISFVITFGMAVFYLMVKTPIFTRTTQLLIKPDDKKGGFGANMMAFQNIGFGVGNVNVNNEILTISAPVMVEKVVKRLGLDTEYSTKKGLKTIPLYHTNPIAVSFGKEFNDSSFITFNVLVNSKQSARITDIEYFNKFENEVVDWDEEYDATIDGGVIKTPIGSFKVTSTPQWTEKCIGKEIRVTKHNLISISRRYSSNMGVGLNEKDATVLNIAIKDASVRRADDILYTLIDEYNVYWVKEKNKIAESTVNFINERLETLTEELKEADESVSQFKSNYLMPDMKASLEMSYKQKADNYATILRLNNQLSMCQFIHDQLVDKSKKDELLPANSGMGSESVEELIGTYNKMLLDRANFLENSTANSATIRDMDRRIAGQKTIMLQSIENLIEQTKKQIVSFEDSENDITNEIADAPRQVKELRAVQRQQSVKEALYIFLLQKREENELSRTNTATISSIIQPPMGNTKPSSPRKVIVLAIAFVFGLIIPAAIIYLREINNTRVRGRKDIDHMMTPLLGEIPNMMTKQHWWQRKKEMKRRIVVEPNNKDIVNESFRIVRTKLDYFLRSKNNAKVVMFTSFNPGSGKSFITGNLVKAVGLNGKHILAIDMDIRHCSLSGFLTKTAHQGVTSYLSGSNMNLDELIVKDALYKGVDILPVGVIPPNPTELLYSENLAKLFAEVKDKYDYIFLDCPPIDIVADATIIKDYADVSIFVIRAGLMDRRLLPDVDVLYQQNKYNNLALLLNGTDFVSGKFGKYRYGYTYGYGGSSGYYGGSYYNQK